LDEAQRAGAVQTHKLLSVTTVGFDAITGADRDQRRSDDVACDTQAREQPQQLKAAGAGLVADRQAIGPAEALDEAADRALGRLDALHLRLAARRRQNGGDDRELVHVQGDPQTHVCECGRANVRHG
jgi:hypothetical protein